MPNPDFGDGPGRLMWQFQGCVIIQFWERKQERARTCGEFSESKSSRVAGAMIYPVGGKFDGVATLPVFVDQLCGKVEGRREPANSHRLP